MSESPPPEAIPAPPQTELYNQVFGGADSDVSDLSDSDDERPPPRLPFPARPAAAGSPAPLPSDEDDDDDDDEEDAYVPATATTAAKIPSFKKTRKEEGGYEDDEAEDRDDGEKRRKRKKKNVEGKTKSRRKERRAEAVEAEDEAEPVYDEATLRRRALEERINNIGKKVKVVRRKKQADEEGDIVDSYHDEICVRLRDRMISAAEKDEIANKNKLPATSKLAMLDEVMGVLRNQTLWSSIVDNGVLEAVKRWLEPLPDRSLPAVGIQKAVFEVLPKMDLDTTTLKEFRLGPIVLFYTKTKRVTPAINRQADALVQAWSRPIIQRPANFRSRHIASAADIEARNEAEEVDGDDDDGEETQRSTQARKGPAKPRRFDVKSAMKENIGRKGARLPAIQEIQYTVAPAPRLQHHVEDLQYVSRVQMDNKKFNRFARQLKAGKATR